MPRATYNFPAGFLWGTATAAHQVEGYNTNNDWWALEQEPGRILNGDKSGKACDWWAGRWREDMDRAQDTWQNAHRFSVEWSRVQPEPDRWDESALDRYREMLIGMRERNITPMITLHHFSLPLWLAAMGGWENEEIADLFQTFTRRTVEALKAHCSLWITINEPNVLMSGGYMNGGFPPLKNDMTAGLRALANMVRGHAAAYHAIHEIQPDAQVGVAHHWRGFKPANRGPLSAFISKLHHKIFNNSFAYALKDGKFDAVKVKMDLPEAAGTQDFLGLNYYTGDLVKFDLSKGDDGYARRFYPPDADLSETGFLANDPQGFMDAIRWISQFDLPIYITENGCEDGKDDFRRRYLLQHLHALWKMINQNIPIKGYFHWSLTDNFEWERGWSQKFGLWELDPATQIRTKRKSVDLYAEICRGNAITSELVEKFAPEEYDKLYPA